MKDEGLSVDVQFLKRLPIPTVDATLRSRIESAASEILTASQTTGDSARIPTLEFRLNDLVTTAFALTDAELQVLQGSLPPRDPISELRSAVQAFHAPPDPPPEDPHRCNASRGPSKSPATEVHRT
jgi:hypothetical protein